MESSQETPVEIPNVFAEKKKKNYAYQQLRKGNRLMGIVGIKAFEKLYQGKPIQKYRVVFRDKEIPDAFGNISFGAATKKGCQCREFVEECYGVAFVGDYVDRDIMHKKLVALLGKWFNVDVKYKPSNDPLNPYINLTGFEMLPNQEDFEDALTYFKEIPVTEAQV